MGSTHALNLFFLQHVQQPDLGLGRELPDFVKKDSSLVGPFETSPLLAYGAGESTLLVTEEFAVQQGLGDCTAVHLYERPVPAC